MGTPLDEILTDGESEPVTEVAETVEPEVEAQSAEPEVTDDGEPQAEPEPSDDEPKGWQYAAYKDEKTKRQELEKRDAEREARLQAIQQRNQQLEQFYQQQQQQAAEQDPRVMAQQVQQNAEQLAINARLDASEINARGAHGDDKVDAALKALQSSPDGRVAYQQIMTSKHPWDAMVKWHAKQETLAKIGDDPDAYIAAQVQAKLAELQGVQPGQQGKPAVDPNALPTDLSQTRNVGTRTSNNWSGPTPLDAIFKD